MSGSSQIGRGREGNTHSWQVLARIPLLRCPFLPFFIFEAICLIFPGDLLDGLRASFFTCSVLAKETGIHNIYSTVALYFFISFDEFSPYD